MTPIQQLIGLLEQNADLYEQMAKRLDDESVAIQQNDLALLNETVKEKENLVLKLKMIEEARKKLLTKLGERLNIPVEEINIRGLAGMPEHRQDRETLLAVRDRLKKAAAKATERNEFNRRLLSRAMGIMKDSMRYLNNLLGGPSETYTNGRTVAEKISSGMVVTRIT